MKTLFGALSEGLQGRKGLWHGFSLDPAPGPRGQNGTRTDILSIKGVATYLCVERSAAIHRERAVVVSARTLYKKANRRPLRDSVIRTMVHAFPAGLAHRGFRPDRSKYLAEAADE